MIDEGGSQFRVSNAMMMMMRYLPLLVLVVPAGDPALGDLGRRRARGCVEVCHTCGMCVFWCSLVVFAVVVKLKTMFY